MEGKQGIESDRNSAFVEQMWRKSSFEYSGEEWKATRLGAQFPKIFYKTVLSQLKIMKNISKEADWPQSLSMTRNRTKDDAGVSRNKEAGSRKDYTGEECNKYRN